MRRSSKIVFVIAAFPLAAVACSLDEGAVIIEQSPDGGSVATDASRDGASPDGSTPVGDASTKDSGDAAVFVDSGGDATPATTFSCGAAHVANCATDCPAAPIDCPPSQSCVAACFGTGGCAGNNFQCDACENDGGVALSRCEPGDASAFSECLSGLNRCPCASGNASACVGNNQTCENFQCFECGEVDAGNQDTHLCEKGGGATCHINSGTYGSCHN